MFPHPSRQSLTATTSGIAAPSEIARWLLTRVVGYISFGAVAAAAAVVVGLVVLPAQVDATVPEPKGGAPDVVTPSEPPAIVKTPPEGTLLPLAPVIDPAPDPIPVARRPVPVIARNTANVMIPAPPRPTVVAALEGSPGGVGPVTVPTTYLQYGLPSTARDAARPRGTNRTMLRAGASRSAEETERVAALEALANGWDWRVEGMGSVGTASRGDVGRIVEMPPDPNFRPPLPPRRPSSLARARAAAR